MENRFHDLLKSVRLSSVVLILIGAVLLIHPDFGSKAVTLTLGWGLVIAGGLSVGAAVFARMTFGFGTMGSGLVMLLFGMLIVSKPAVLASLFGVVLGAYLVFSGLGSLADAGRLRRNGLGWGFGTIWGAISVAGGIYLIVSPAASSRLVMMTAGILMIACGIGSIVTHAKLSRFLREQTSARIVFDPEDDDIIDV